MKEGHDPSLQAALDALKKSATMAKTPLAGAEKTSEKGDYARNPPEKARENFLSKFIGVFNHLWNGWARPVTRFLTPVTRRVLRFYGWSFDKFAHKKDADGARVFSRQRAAIVTLALALLTLAVPYLLFRNVIPATSRAIYDASMLATMKEDHLYLGRAELINPDRQLYQVMGCRDIKGCEGGDNTTYYRLRDNIILDIRYWTTRFEPYDPAEIAGAMVSELNDCRIRYYGRRSKALGWYPYIVSASCTPV